MSLEHFAAAVRQPHRRRVDPERLDHRPRHRLERGLERKAVGERVGDLVLRAQPPRELALGGERDLEP